MQLVLIGGSLSLELLVREDHRSAVRFQQQKRIFFSRKEKIDNSVYRQKLIFGRIMGEI